MTKPLLKQSITRNKFDNTNSSLISGKRMRPQGKSDKTDNEDIEIKMLLEVVNLKYGYNLKHYSMAFLKRRFLRRLSLSGINSISEMQHLALVDSTFFETMMLDISILVTEMFRDPSFYMALRKEVVPYLRTFPFIRIWIAGCASGEEVYSMAILLKEEGLSGKSQIYATDFNEIVLHKAKSGIFPVDFLKKYTSNYQQAGGTESFADYYTADDHNAIMDNSLKENITFANHNLITDGIFNEMNLVLCRNVLIYFDRELKNHVIKLFYDSLYPNGLLCLGTKESLKFTEHANSFINVAENEKIYRKLPKVQNVQDEWTDHHKNYSGYNRAAYEDTDKINNKYEAVVIGVSSGGLKALSLILSSLPDSFVIPIIIVQHQTASSGDLLVKILKDKCWLPVKEAEEKEFINPGTIYIAPPDYHLMIEHDRAFSLSASEPYNHARPSIDILFETAADTYRSKLIGIILTGANNDGSQGLWKIKEMGGLTIVQDPATAEVDAMPKSAIAASKTEHVLTLEQIGQFLADMERTLKEK